MTAHSSSVTDQRGIPCNKRETIHLELLGSTDFYCQCLCRPTLYIQRRNGNRRLYLTTFTQSSVLKPQSVAYWWSLNEVSCSRSLA